MTQQSVASPWDNTGMVESEWLEITARLSERFPHADLPVATLRRWGADLADLPGVHVSAAVETLCREGLRFAPNSGQIRQRAVELALDAPEWAAVLDTLRRLIKVSAVAVDVAAWEAGADEVSADAVAYPRNAAAAREHPMIAGFIAALGWDQIEPGLDGGNEEARLREKWARYVAASVRAESFVGIEPGGLRELERINRDGGPAQIGGGVGEFKRRAIAAVGSGH